VPPIEQLSLAEVISEKAKPKVYENDHRLLVNKQSQRSMKMTIRKF
jgi:hypothetical protein